MNKPRILKNSEKKKKIILVRPQNLNRNWFTIMKIEKSQRINLSNSESNRIRQWSFKAYSMNIKCNCRAVLKTRNILKYFLKELFSLRSKQKICNNLRKNQRTPNEIMKKSWRNVINQSWIFRIYAIKMNHIKKKIQLSKIVMIYYLFNFLKLD